MSLLPLDRERLFEALALARTSFGLTEPNPRVGCVIGLADGRVLGRGATQQAGGAHAEVMALRDTSNSGASARGATAWVSLEPCSHHGRTPPCCDALIAAGIARVVVAVGDPHPSVNGGGLARLQAAGIDVQMADAEIAEAAREVNIGFFSRVQRGRPWVRLKAAASLDGATALLNGKSQWITGAAARRDGQLWRQRASAVLTGIGTVLADDPQLDVRDFETAHQPARVVVDSRFRTPSTARVLRPTAKVWIFGARDPQRAGDELRASGAVLMRADGRDGKVDLQAVLRALVDAGVNELHVEAGAVLNGALLEAGLVDELLLYLAPKLLGPGRPIASWPALESLQQARELRLFEVQAVGEDLRIRARPSC